jgi:hypothetical protein
MDRHSTIHAFPRSNGRRWTRFCGGCRHLRDLGVRNKPRLWAAFRLLPTIAGALGFLGNRGRPRLL